MDQSSPASRTQRPTPEGGARPPGRLGLSLKLLLLTVLFVMLAEVLIFVPSVANFRINWLMQRIQAAQIAALVAEAAPSGALPQRLREELLMAAQVRGIAIKSNEQRRLVLSENMPPNIDSHHDLRSNSAWQNILDALAVYAHGEGRVIRVLGQPEMSTGETVEIVISEAPLKAAMVRFGLSILGLSIIISMIAATLVYLALNWLLVRPMRRITDSMLHFAEAPEDASRIIAPSGRADEVGAAERELARMQHDLRDMLQQKSRLAALGLAVSKINHDLRNILANAQLISDRLGSVKDPTVERITPKLIASLGRAIRLCQETLAYGRASEPVPQRRRFPVAPLVEEMRESLGLPATGRPELLAMVEPNLELDADPDQIFRILANLCRNALEALEARSTPERGRITIMAARQGRGVRITVSDNGPGIPEHARSSLFVPFHGSARAGGTGLGLAIVDELVRAHGGSVRLADSGSEGAMFVLEIPDRDPRERRSEAAAAR